MKLLGRSDARSRFVDEMLPRVEVSGFIAQTKPEEYALRKNIAEIMFDVASFACVIGLNPRTENIEHVTMKSELQDKLLGEYQFGRIQLANSYYPMLDRTIAHEMFHNMQDGSHNMQYTTRVQRSYVEGGAQLFEGAFRSLYDPVNGQLYFKPSQILLPISFSEMELEGIHSKLTELKRAARGCELHDLLNRTHHEGRETSVHLNGADFVAVAIRIMHDDIPKLLRMMLNLTANGTISVLEEMGEDGPARRILARLRH